MSSADRPYLPFSTPETRVAAGPKSHGSSPPHFGTSTPRFSPATFASMYAMQAWMSDFQSDPKLRCKLAPAAEIVLSRPRGSSSILTFCPRHVCASLACVSHRWAKCTNRKVNSFTRRISSRKITPASRTRSSRTSDGLY